MHHLLALTTPKPAGVIAPIDNGAAHDAPCKVKAFVGPAGPTGPAGPRVKNKKTYTSRGDWDPEDCERFGLDIDIASKIVELVKSHLYFLLDIRYQPINSSVSIS